MKSFIRLKPEQVGLLSSLMNECFSYCARHPEGVETWYASMDDLVDCYGIYENDILVGYIMTLRRNENDLYIAEIGVTKKYRRKGFGSWGMKKLIATTPCTHISLMVRENYLGAQLFYENLGFKRGNKFKGFDAYFPEEVGVEYMLEL